MSQNFIKNIEINRYILWQIDENNSVFLFKENNNFMISSFLDGQYKSVLFTIKSDNTVEVIEKEGSFGENFDFNVYYSELQDKTQNVEGMLM